MGLDILVVVGVGMRGNGKTGTKLIIVKLAKILICSTQRFHRNNNYEDDEVEKCKENKF